MPAFQESGRAAAMDGAARALRPVSPSDDADLPDGLTRGLYVGGAGALNVVDAYGVVAKIVSGASQYHPIAIRRVLATGTTATDVVALY